MGKVFDFKITTQIIVDIDYVVYAYLTISVFGDVAHGFWNSGGGGILIFLGLQVKKVLMNK